MKNSAYMTRILRTVWVVFVAYGALTLVGGCSDDGYKYRFKFEKSKELTAKVGGIKWHYVCDDEEAIIVMASGYDVATGNCEIKLPASLGGLPVKSVCGSVFRSDSHIQSLTIPEGVLDLAACAFAGVQIDEVSIPSSVTNIDVNAFSGSKCRKFVVSDDSRCFSSVNGWLCTKDGKRLVRAAWGETRIPPGVERVPDCAFALSEIKSVVLPDSLEHIGLNAFFGCEELVSITIPRKVRNINAFTFEGCTNLERVDFPVALTNIGAYAFEGCKKLSDVAIPQEVTRIDEYAFANCVGLRTLAIPSSVKYIGAHAFSACGNGMRTTMDVSNANICPNAFSSVNHLSKERGVRSMPDRSKVEIPIDILMQGK